MGRHSKPDLPGQYSDTRPRRYSDPGPAGPATGSHRAVGTESVPRGIAKWPFAVLAALAIVAAGVFAVMWGSGSLGNRADAESGDCSEGRKTLRLMVTPRLVGSLEKVGDRWNAADRVVDAHCVSVEVTGADRDEALQALSQADDVLALPAVWVPESAEAGAQLADTRIATQTVPLKSDAGFLLPYIVINGKGVDEVQQRAAQEFRDYLGEPAQNKVLQNAGFEG